MYVLKSLREQRKLTQFDISKKLNISRSTYTHYENGSRKPDHETLIRLSELFDVSIDYLLSNERVADRVDVHSITMPLYDTISCGTGCFIDDVILEHITLPIGMLKKHKEYYAQYADGDSMINENIYPGDLLIFEKTNQALANGQVGEFCVDDGVATCKKFMRVNDDIVTLLPANDKYEPIIVTADNKQFRILGKLALVINKR